MNKPITTAIIGSKIIVETEILHDHVLVFTETINEVITTEAFLKKYKSSIQDGIQIVEHDGFVSPGFVDIHIHGAGGSDTMDGSLESLKTISKKS